MDTAAGTQLQDTETTGITGAASATNSHSIATPTGGTRCSSACSNAVEKLSIRSDWSSEMFSEDDFSPLKSAKAAQAALQSAGLDGDVSSSETGGEGSPALQSLSEKYSQSLRSGRRTRTISKIFEGDQQPIRIGVHSIQNLRREMEDAHRAVVGEEGPLTARTQAEAPLSPLSYFAVFDGHGGSAAAEFAAERLYSLLAENASALRADASQALREAFERTEQDWITHAVEKEWMDGTTAAVALVDRGRRRVTVGNVGDSEVLLGTRNAAGESSFKVLSEVHHVKRSETERNRILEEGGKVWRGRLGHPVISPAVLSLSVSRAIGDLFYKHEKYTNGLATGLIARPFITSTEVCNPESIAEFLLIGCDGFWDTVSYEKATEFVFKRLSGPNIVAQEISEALVNLAKSQGSSDNITVLVALL
mmetsp:Transcript_39499/g.92888  ORF Transcript_39499/g.92888 Transcript_39499/m.92888 type:complete len:421 (+) Transcript_39499:71-1333(+)